MEHPETALADWESGQATGDALIYPRLDNFTDSKPTTMDYRIQLGASGYLLDKGSLKVIYEAGDVLVTGSNGAITDVDVVPRSEDTPSLQIIESNE